MLFDAIWLMYGLGIGIFLSVGLLGLFYSCSLSVGGGVGRGATLALSVLIILAGVYFFCAWGSQKTEIREMGQQVELAVRQYLK